MITSMLKKVFGTRHDREMKRIKPVVDAVGALEPKMKAMSDSELSGQTAKFRERLKDSKVELTSLLPEAFATVREAARRRLNMRHFDMQIVGGVVLHEGKIAEMKTGEGKTLVATLPLYLNALAGKGAHLVTVNDYLAKRDSRWMGPVYHMLGLSVGIIQHDASFIYDPSYQDSDPRLLHLRPVTRKEAYLADITYGTNNEFGFDYLRDNMKYSLEEYVQREHHYAIVDEVDSILIDEARTPLIISGPTEDSTDKYYQIDRIIPGLKKETHYTVDEKAQSVFLTEAGVDKVEELLNVENLYDPASIETLHHVTQALHAHVLKQRDVHYVVKDGQVIIVDEFTGRLMTGRRWSDGLHQAVEAKEKVQIENENQTLASITFQNYFRMYTKLAGMTGTADTEATEFATIYGLDVTVIPTNKPMVRNDTTDLVYKTVKEKYDAAIAEISECYKIGKPVLVGTISVEASEKLAKQLSRHGIPHNVLNAKQHEREAEIVAQAGRLKAVTISTNMAGRGTDIVLGGNPAIMALVKAGTADDASEEYQKAYAEAKAVCDDEKKKVLELGGLHIVGTERHESRRIDNQLRGRSGRQGDPGESRFYLSLEDDLLRIFGGDKITKIMDWVGMEEGVPIEHKIVSRSVENAQKKVEAHNFDMRKHLLEYDDVMNQQRRVIYDYRKQILSGEGVRELVKEFMEFAAEDVIVTHVEGGAKKSEWNLKGLCDSAYAVFGVKLSDAVLTRCDSGEALLSMLTEEAWAAYQEKVSTYGEPIMAHFERFIMLSTIDALWKDHLLTMDHLRGSIGLRGYGQKNPLNEYKKEGFELFETMIGKLRGDVTERLFKIQIRVTEQSPELDLAEKARNRKLTLSRGEEPGASGSGEGEDKKAAPVKRVGDKIGRNDPCPCGSGKKYKKCCGVSAAS